MGFQPNDPGSRLNNGSGLQIPAAAPNLAKPRQRRTRSLGIRWWFEPKGRCPGSAPHHRTLGLALRARKDHSWLDYESNYPILAQLDLVTTRKGT